MDNLSWKASQWIAVHLYRYVETIPDQNMPCNRGIVRSSSLSFVSCTRQRFIGFYCSTDSYIAVEEIEGRVVSEFSKKNKTKNNSKRIVWNPNSWRAKERNHNTKLRISLIPEARKMNWSKDTNTSTKKTTAFSNYLSLNCRLIPHISQIFLFPPVENICQDLRKL